MYSFATKASSRGKDFNVQFCLQTFKLKRKRFYGAVYTEPGTPCSGFGWGGEQISSWSKPDPERLNPASDRHLPLALIGPELPVDRFCFFFSFRIKIIECCDLFKFSCWRWREYFIQLPWNYYELHVQHIVWHLIKDFFIVLMFPTGFQCYPMLLNAWGTNHVRLLITWQTAQSWMS